jgi:hypothetical protein
MRSAACGAGFKPAAMIQRRIAAGAWLLAAAAELGSSTITYLA